MNKHIRLIVSFTLAAAVAAPAGAQFARAEDAVKYRQSAWYVLSQHFARIGAMVNGRAPYDARGALENAELVSALARVAARGFCAGVACAEGARAGLRPGPGATFPKGQAGDMDRAGPLQGTQRQTHQRVGQA